MLIKNIFLIVVLIVLLIGHNTCFVNNKKQRANLSCINLIIKFVKNICLHVFIQFVNNIIMITRMIVLLCQKDMLMIIDNNSFNKY